MIVFVIFLSFFGQTSRYEYLKLGYACSVRMNVTGVYGTSCQTEAFLHKGQHNTKMRGHMTRPRAEFESTGKITVTNWRIFIQECNSWWI